ncbi:hypothetical protein HZB02_02275 [Candidatus Woesearchaeota archaeon]|nr:hypothetical protein [Candidatus Woesearchaeota archaeon]
MELRVNTAFRNVKAHHDDQKRSEHVFERMQLRGIGVEQIKEAVQKGAKKLRDDGSVVSHYRWFKVIYREFRVEDTKKIYPITVIEV